MDSNTIGASQVSGLRISEVSVFQGMRVYEDGILDQAKCQPALS